MTSEMLSIITPSYNQSDFIEQNIKSVSAQANDDIEHIIVDGGSDDGTIDIIKKYEDKYNLRWVSESDRGQTHALNKGIQMASGDWIGWQNSDDYYSQSAFDIFRQTRKDHPTADAIYGDLVIVDEEGNQIAQQFMTRPSTFIQRHWSLFASNQSLFIRRSVFDEISYLDEELQYTMDAELTWKLLTQEYELVHVPETIGVFRVQPNAKTYQDVDRLQEKELREIYGTTRYEKIIPNSLLQTLAKATKAAYLILDRNFEAIEYNIQ